MKFLYYGSVARTGKENFLTLKNGAVKPFLIDDFIKNSIFATEPVYSTVRGRVRVALSVPRREQDFS